MQWDPETTDWELWLPLISPLAGRVWAWLLSIPGPGKRQVAPSGKVQPFPRPGRDRGPSVALPPASGPELLEGGSCRESHVWVQSWAECLEPGPPFGPPQPTLGPQCPGDSPMGPRLDPAAELCGGGWPTSWLTEGSLLTPPCTLFMGERTGP